MLRAWCVGQKRAENSIQFSDAQMGALDTLFRFVNERWGEGAGVLLT